MKTKKRDVPYCGVDKDKIFGTVPSINTEMFQDFVQMIKDRYRIHKRKDVKGMPKPWTNNPIMQQYKFTNVRREHDRQTKYLLDNITHNGELTLEDKIVNTFLFRAWNNWDTLHDLGLPADAQRLYNPSFKETIRPIYKKLYKSNPERKWWSNAFNQGGFKMVWGYPDGTARSLYEREGAARHHEKDIPLRPLHIAPYLKEHDIVTKLLQAKNQLECFKVIKTVPGYADFMAYQVFVDLTYIREFPFSENEFTIAGPGCKRGLYLLFIDKAGMTYEECLFWLRDSWEDLCGDFDIPWDADMLFSDLPEYDRYMNVMSLENCFCEFSKYMRAKTGQGRPRIKYKGV